MQKRRTLSVHIFPAIFRRSLLLFWGFGYFSKSSQTLGCTLPFEDYRIPNTVMFGTQNSQTKVLTSILYHYSSVSEITGVSVDNSGVSGTTGVSVESTGTSGVATGAIFGMK
jgi:hypothetical protein